MAKVARPAPSEHAEQVMLINWAKALSGPHPELALLHAIPNGGDRNTIVAGKLKAEGVKRGVPDLFLPVARHGFHGLYIEMKRQTGGVLSQHQVWWIKELRNQGYMVEVCKGFNHAADVIRDYLGLPKGV